MSDEVPSGRLSQIFDSLTNLQQQQILQARRRSASSSSPSPASSGRVTPSTAQAGAQPFAFHHQHFSNHAHTYYMRAQDGNAYLHTFPAAAATQAHHHHHHLHHMQSATHFYTQQQHAQHQQQQQQPQQQMYCGAQQQQQQMSLPPMYASQSLNSSPLLTKRATSFSGNIPLTRPHCENFAAMRISAATAAIAGGSGVSQSTPNSPRLMPRRAQRPPPIPAKPSAATLQSVSAGSGACSSGASAVDSSSASANAGAMAKKPTASDSRASEKSDSSATATINPGLAALDTDAPWPHFSTLTEHLDVHQVNNYAQPVPEINWQERCLELQLELHRSKNQAGRIRDMLREKISKFL
ncbi:transcription factor btd-like [Anastrepha obliqua]|uniref:transcription factor btd-like n=1 Tax=Anastrepha obliqua TaxID=95512 RepID=UPI00240910D9|nr:transcription factor btd-like [Anastrepha obliqua]